MIILGVDPGTAATGYGVIEGEVCPRLLEYGCLQTSNEESMVSRLRKIYFQIKSIVNKFLPSEVAIEEVFFNRNVKTALLVGQARGVIILAASDRGAGIFSYTPLEIKQAITGYGKASKKQVQEMIKRTLNMSFLPSPDDAADAIAVALCHFYSRKLKISGV